MKFEKNFAVAFFKQRKAIWSILETIVITLILLFLAVSMRPNDPFSLYGPFPWIIVAPVFCTLLFGAMDGVISLIILLLYLMFQYPINNIDNFLLREYVVGITCLTLFIGIVSSYWLARIRHVEYLNRYVREHLDDLSRDYYQLRISHERLEHAYIVKPLSFRDAYSQIKQEILKNNCVMDTSLSQQLLNIFSQFCSINCAVFSLYEEKTQKLTTMAYLGNSFPVSLQDPLVETAIRNNITTYYAVNKLGTDDSSDYLAVIPLLDEFNKIIGLIIIKEMPFWSLTHDNLEVLTVFAATFALQFSTIRQVQHLMALFPSCPPEFLREFQRLISLRKNHQVDSALSAVLINEGFTQKNIAHSLEQHRRSLDYTWVLPINNSLLFLTLMPLTSEEGIHGFKKRLADWLKSEFGQELNKNGLNFRYHLLNDQTVEKQLNDFIKECSHADY